MGTVVRGPFPLALNKYLQTLTRIGKQSPIHVFCILICWRNNTFRGHLPLLYGIPMVIKANEA